MKVTLQVMNKEVYGPAEIVEVPQNRDRQEGAAQAWAPA